MCRRRVNSVAFAIALSVCSLVAHGSQAEEECVADPAPSNLLREILVATGTPRETVVTAEIRLRSAVERTIERVGGSHPTYAGARKLHRALHKRPFGEYEQQADGVLEMLHEGSFNCVSATLFFGLVARELGYDVQVLEGPGHLMLRLLVEGRPIDVETTLVDGFDLDRKRRAAEATWNSPEPWPAASWAERPESARLPRPAIPAGYADRMRAVTLEQAVGFAWLNRATREVRGGRRVAAAESVLEAARHVESLEGTSVNIRGLLNIAFLPEYEAGRFEAAYRIAEIELELWPGTTTPSDRLVASAAKQIGAACERGSPRAAWDRLEQVRTKPASSEAVRRLTRTASGEIARTAVRVGDWDLAWVAAEQYAATELDTHESQRIFDWIEERRDAVSLDACR
ncbi:MAG: hypothetical protein GY716_15240 [bacterium]|nr:hypothetical protein [bacterium]